METGKKETIKETEEGDGKKEKKGKTQKRKTQKRNKSEKEKLKKERSSLLE